jgi:hypothetical protein
MLNAIRNALTVIALVGVPFTIYYSDKLTKNHPVAPYYSSGNTIEFRSNGVTVFINQREMIIHNISLIVSAGAIFATGIIFTFQNNSKR